MRTYDVYDPESDKLIASGSVAECAEQLGLTKNGFRHALDRSERGTNKKHRIVARGEIPLRRGNREFSCSDLLAIQAWDAFMEPLRKEFGIPVRRLKQEDKRNGK